MAASDRREEPRPTMSDEASATVREASVGDAPIIATFNVRMAAESESRRLDPRIVRSGVEHGLSRPEFCRYYVAEHEGVVVGQLMITYEWSDWRDGVFWWIQSVYVEPEHRRRGVFRALFRHVERLARQGPDVCGLRLYVDEHNERAMATYAGLGMKPSGHRVYELDWSDAVS